VPAQAGADEGRFEKKRGGGSFSQSEESSFFSFWFRRPSLATSFFFSRCNSRPPKNLSFGTLRPFPLPFAHG